MGEPPIPLSESTANPKAGQNGLWKLASKVNRLAASWKYCEDMARENLGVHEVECQAWTRSRNRAMKKGATIPALRKGRYGKNLIRDKRYIKAQMELRTQQAKEDWWEVRQELNSLKTKLIKEAKGTSEENRLRREFIKIRKHNEAEFQKMREKHQQQIVNIKNRITQRNPINHEANKRQELEDLREKWIQETVSQKESIPPKQKVHIYGNITIDKDEEACAMLGPKWTDYPALNPGSMKFESLLCHTKSRYGRMSLGSPQEQDQDDHDFPEEPALNDTQTLLLNEDKMVYNHRTKTLDMRKLTATSIKDCPRLFLPPARPQQEEQEIFTKESLWNQAYNQFMARNTHQESGKVLYDTMTKSERRGYHKLRKRSQANELVISTTHKSTEINLSSFESYAQQGEPHVAKDRKVTWKEVNKSKREVLCLIKKCVQYWRK